LPVFKADPKQFIEDMQKIEERAFSDSYKKKDVIVANSDDYGEEEEEFEPKKASTSNPFGGGFGGNIFVGGFGGAPKLARPSKAAYKGSSRAKYEETNKSSSSNPNT